MPAKWLLGVVAGWLTPRSTDPEESFREGAIRLILPICMAGYAVVLWYRHGVQAKPAPWPFSVESEVGLWVVLTILSLVTLLRRKTVLSGVFLLLSAAHVDLLGLAVYGYANVFAQMTLMLNVLAAVLILPTSFLLLYTLALIGAYGIITHTWYQGLPVDDRLLLEGSPAVTTAGVAAVLFTTVALAGYVRIEVDRRIRALQDMVATLEERVARRTMDLTRANEQLEALSRIKGEFVANVSHELRSPITSLKMHLQLLSLQPEKHDEHVVTLERETDRLENLIEGLLTLSRLDQDRLEVHSTPVDLNALVKMYVADRTAVAQNKGLTLAFDVASNPPPVKADQRLLEQVLSTLLTNALNYTPAGGRVMVSTEACQLDGRQWAGFSVSDTGPGIPPGEREQLFVRFFRGKAGHKSGVSGAGLGLAIAGEVVERHGGRIEVESEGVPGKGATFRVWLPVGE